MMRNPLKLQLVLCCRQWCSMRLLSKDMCNLNIVEEQRKEESVLFAGTPSLKNRLIENKY